MPPVAPASARRERFRRFSHEGIVCSWPACAARNAADAGFVDPHVVHPVVLSGRQHRPGGESLSNKRNGVSWRTGLRRVSIAKLVAVGRLVRKRGVVLG